VYIGSTIENFVRWSVLALFLRLFYILVLSLGLLLLRNSVQQSHS